MKRGLIDKLIDTNISLYCCLNTSSSSKIFRVGTLGIYLVFNFDNQSAAKFCVDTIKYYSIPSVPSGLEGVKTRPSLSVLLIAATAAAAH